MNFLKKSGNKFQRHSTIPIVIGETGALQDKIEKSKRIKWILFRRCLTLISSRKSMITTVMPITCSIGIYGIKEEDTAKDAFIHLDKAIYNAKNNGRNCVSL